MMRFYCILFSLLLIILFVITTVRSYKTTECLSRDFGNGSPVCVCNSEHCDLLSLNDESSLTPGRVVVYSSSKSGMRFHRKLIQWESSDIDVGNFIVLDKKKMYQNITGFGGAFTDSACSNILSLPEASQNNLLNSYFGKGGIGYSIGRVPIASCDFSPSNYSYDDTEGDFDLHDFSLVDQDTLFRIPLIKRVMQISQHRLRLYGCTWSAPYWMKTNQMMQGVGTLIGKPGGRYYKTWAKYFIKYLDEYAKFGVAFWGLSVQNQPSNGFDPNFKIQSMGLTPKLERDFVKFDLGPALRQSQHRDIKLMIFDDQRYTLPKWIVPILNDTEAARYVSYIAVHWYGNTLSPPQLLDETHEMFPEIPIIGTEASVIGPPGEKVLLGSWERAEQYAKDIIETLNYWFTGWTDWNLALNLQGGPNAFSNFVDSPIIVNESSGEFYKQPMFYAMGHFSAFLPPNSSRVDLSLRHPKLPSKRQETEFKKCIMSTAFANPNGTSVVILLNLCDSEMKFGIMEKYNNNRWLPVAISAHTLQTVLWK